MTGKSKDNVYQYLFSAEVKDMTKLENAIKNEFAILREEKSREIYFYNSALFANYVKFIKSHKLFVKEVLLRPKKKTSRSNC